MDIGIHSTVGPRETLEDAALGASLVVVPCGIIMPVLILCDGVGGCSHGEVASATGVASVFNSLGNFGAEQLVANARHEVDVESAAVALYQALLAANDAVLKCARGMRDGEGMATTIVCGVVVDSKLVLGWAGDSRCYLRSRSGLHCLSFDHTAVAALLDAGLITDAEVEGHPDRHTVTEYLGKPEAFRPQLSVEPLATGDMLIFCSDGLTDVLPDEDIDALIASRPRTDSAEVIARSLVEQAIALGTSDNTTVLVYRHVSSKEEPHYANTQTDGYAAALVATIHRSFMEYYDEPKFVEAVRATHAK